MHWLFMRFCDTLLPCQLERPVLLFSGATLSPALVPLRVSGFQKLCKTTYVDWMPHLPVSVAQQWLLSTADDNDGGEGSPYQAELDPYCYEGTAVLKNKAGLSDAVALEKFEAAMTFVRAQEPLPTGDISLEQYAAIHRHLFQDVYGWAGEYRTVALSKSGNVFCFPEHIPAAMRDLFEGLSGKNYLRGLSLNNFAAEAARCIGELNAIHPFREGNGRAQFSFLAVLAEYAGHPLKMEAMNADVALDAMVRSFRKEYDPLTKLITHLASQV